MSAGDEAQIASRWLSYAQEDLQVADRLLAQDDLAPRYACWLSQQAAEKALKALLLLETGTYKQTHDLHDLADLLPEALDGRIPRSGLSLLTQLYIESRYPGRYAEATAEAAATARAAARAVYDAVSGEFRHRGIAAET
ncbi:MAG: HEPN domain-containing protein [Chloroflexota bacterium]|nr:HEPN domain-containing protein [Chloroflexota bacterium]